MKLWSESFEHGAPIPEAFAFGKRDAAGQIVLAGNRSPHLGWSELPAGTRSLVLLCHDPDVPSRPDDVNQAGRRVPRDLPRVDFFHWSLLDIDPHTPSLPEGALLRAATPMSSSILSAPTAAVCRVTRFQVLNLLALLVLNLLALLVLHFERAYRRCMPRHALPGALVG